ncbi:MAG: cytochrome c oxidase subunit II [Sporichthyaceae bacterium]|nr:cytochrome c oxidase subunit II [Sporichthyaceae bacterium]
MKTARRAAPAALLALPPLLAGCAPESITAEGQAIYRAYNIFMWAAAVVFGLVASLVVWSVIRYRRRDDELPRQVEGHNLLELTWTVLPFLLVIFLFVVTIRAQNTVLHNAPDALTVNVTAFQWSWRFVYEDSGRQVVGGPGNVPEMVVPVNQPILIKLRSADVVHAFYVPRTLFKRQAIPGTTNEFVLRFTQTGTFPGQCTQFCGLAHSDMLFNVRVVSQSSYQQWLSTGQAGASGSAGT